MTVPPFQMGRPKGFDPITAGFALTRATEAIDVLEARTAFGSATWCVAALQDAIEQMEAAAKAIWPETGEANGALAARVADALSGTAYEGEAAGVSAFTQDLGAVAAGTAPEGRSLHQVRLAAERLRNCFRESASQFGR